MATWTAYLSFAIVLGALVGLGVVWGLGAPARAIARFPARKTMLACICLPVPPIGLTALAVVIGSSLKHNGLEGRPAGAAIEIIIAIWGTLLSSVVVGTLLAIGRRSLRLMFGTAITLATAGWTLAGIETFWLADLIIGNQIIDANAYSSKLGRISTVLFFLVSSSIVWLWCTRISKISMACSQAS